MGNQEFSDYPGWSVPQGVRVGAAPPRACPYLPGRFSQVRGIEAQEVSGEVYQQFLDAGFRRSGTILYQPICPGCRECVPIRVSVEGFAPSKTQRRVMRRNADLHVSVSEPRLTSESNDLYSRYLRHWHGREDPAELQGLGEFLYTPVTPSLEFSYRDLSGQLVAVGICDVASAGLSSVYFFFDPDLQKRRLGTFGATLEIEHAKTLGLAWYYLGYWVRGCGAMAYKASFRPFEVLRTDGVWTRPLVIADAPT